MIVDLHFFYPAPLNILNPFQKGVDLGEADLGFQAALHVELLVPLLKKLLYYLKLWQEKVVKLAEPLKKSEQS